MRMDWLPVSAALLLTGALALALGSFLLPTTNGAADAIQVVQDQGGVWMTAAAIDFLAAVCLTLGLPSVLTLVERRGRTLGLTSAVVLAFGFIGTAGYAMLLVFFRALVVTETIRNKGVDDVAHDTGLLIFLYAWLAGFLIGELLLALALLRAGTVPRWVPFLLLLHFVLALAAGLLPDWMGKVTVLFFVIGFAGIAIQATKPVAPRRY
ncbi:hypothetical protein ABLE68_11145 [Nocardioides sp. CN2-186]|uniref:hypothetical protein n=1 Tax=Nocardioides tweenelious TaxID=3156607 RepID=UPI0032B5E027